MPRSTENGKPNVLLEAVVTNVAAGIASAEAGADRLEFCVALETGGLTPSYGAMQALCEAVEIPVHVLIRCREGDFFYSDAEVQEMAEDIRQAKKAGAAGVVFGALQNDFTVAERAIQTWMEAAGKLDITFHRAFDLITDQLQAKRRIGELGIYRILTSASAPTAYEGRYFIRALNKGESQVQILPGGGVNAQNAKAIIEVTGATEIHFSAMKLSKENGGQGLNPDSFTKLVCDVEKIKSIQQALA